MTESLAHIFALKENEMDKHTRAATTCRGHPHMLKHGTIDAGKKNSVNAAFATPGQHRLRQKRLA